MDVERRREQWAELLIWLDNGRRGVHAVHADVMAADVDDLDWLEYRAALLAFAKARQHCSALNGSLDLFNRLNKALSVNDATTGRGIFNRYREEWSVASIAAIVLESRGPNVARLLERHDIDSSPVCRLTAILAGHGDGALLDIVPDTVSAAEAVERLVVKMSVAAKDVQRPPEGFMPTRDILATPVIEPPAWLLGKPKAATVWSIWEAVTNAGRRMKGQEIADTIGCDLNGIRKELARFTDSPDSVWNNPGNGRGAKGYGFRHWP